MIEKQIVDKIKEYKTIIIHGHIRPDGDCYGSQFGLKNIIVNSFKNKQVYVVGQKSDYVSFIGEMDNIKDDEYKNALAIVVDTAILDRISDKRYKLAKEVIKIDHHILVEEYGDFSWVNNKYSSCAEMIASLLFKFDELKIDKEGAKALYVGIVTDTGRFKYKGVTQDTFITAGYLISKKINILEIDELLSTETINAIKFKGYFLNNIKTTKEGFVYAIITMKIIEQFKITIEEASYMIDLIGNIESYPIWAVFIENKNEVRIRLRSRGPRIDLIANEYNGGGHMMASGARIENLTKIEDVVERVNKELREYKNVRQ